MKNLIGSKLPDFELDAYHEDEIQTVRSADFQGRWTVLVFYPADFTFVCPTELEDLAAIYGDFKELGAEVLSVSTDTVYTHKAWHDESPAIGKVEYPMLADPAGKLCKALGTYLKDEGLSLRASFIVDPEGTIKAYEVHDNSIGRSAAELLRKLQAAKFVSEHEGLVCPARWTPGAETLRPGLDLVGEI